MSRKRDVEKLIEEHTRRLQKRKEQQAKYGLAVEPHILTEIEDIEATLVELEEERVALAQIVQRNPYRALAAFREEDEAFFFGRENFSADLADDVRHKPLVAVIGPSGSGKSSVVFAGLLPLLRREDAWLITPFRPGHDPFRALAAALVPLLEPELTERLRLREIKGLSADLSQGDLHLAEITTRILEKTAQADRLLLVADQFEELFSLSKPDVWQRFIETLLQALPSATPAPSAPASGNPHLILTLRADFLGQALRHASLGDALQDNVRLLRPMNPTELQRAIEQPAEQQEVSFEAGLVERILADVSDEPGNLPLLEFALTALWEQQTRSKLTHQAYEAIGQVEGALSRHADEVFEGLGEAEQAQAHRVFVQLVQPGEGTEDTRRLARRTELAGADWTLVQQLATQRLVVTDRGPDEQETVEVVHEALIRSWERLQGWIETDRAFLTWRKRLRIALEQWQASQEDEGALLRGAPLTEAEDWLADRETELSSAERNFIHRSLELRAQEEQAREAQRQRELMLERERAKEQARAARRLRRLVFGLAGVVLVVVAITFVAIRQSRVATARQLAANGLVAFTQENFYLATLLGLEANKLSPGAGDDLLKRVPYQAPYVKGFSLIGQSTGVDSVAWAPKGQRLASGSSDGRIIIWDTASREVLTTLTGHSADVRSVAWAPEGQRLASGSSDGNIIIWDTGSGEALTTLTGHSDRVESLAWHPEGQRLASGAFDDKIIIWDTNSREALTTLAGHSRFVWSVAWHPDGQHLASGLSGGSIIIWDTNSGEALTTLTGHVSWVKGLAWHPDGQRLASGSADDRVIIWDTTSGEALNTLTGHSDWVNSVAWHPDGQRLASGSQDGKIIIWDTTSGEALNTLIGHSNGVRSVAWRPGGQHLASGSWDRSIIIWETTGGETMTTLTGHSSSVWNVAWHPEGRRLASGSIDGSIIIWDTDSGEALTTLAGHSDWVESVTWHPDGQRLASGSRDGRIIIWDADSGEALTTLTGHAGWVNSVAWHPDGQRLASGSGGEIVIWDTDRGEVLTTLTRHSNIVRSLAWYPNGQRLASSSGGNVIIWDTASGEALTTLTGHSTGVGILSVTWHPEGHYLAAGSQDGSIVIWDTINGETLTTLTGHSDWVNSVAWHPKDQRLASGSSDGRIIIWDTDSREALITLTGHSDRVNSVAWHPKGHHLASGSSDKTIQLLPAGFAHHPCQWLISNLSQSQWIEYRGFAVYKPTCENLPSPKVIPLLTRRGRLLLIGTLVLILALIGLMVWGCFKFIKWIFRKWRRRPVSS